MVVSLLTDFGLTDNFVGVIKAVILGINPDIRIVDISHEIEPQNILQGAFLLKGSFKYFPHGSIHLVVIDPGVGSRRDSIIVRTKNYYFVGPDNGVLSLALRIEPPIEIVAIANEKYFLKPVSYTFHGRDIFAPVAAYLSKGININEFGRRVRFFKKLNLPAVKISSRNLKGEIIYIDRFGNLISNVDRDTLGGFIKNKGFKIRIEDKIIDKLSFSYAEGKKDRPLAIINSFDYLEFAFKDASAKDCLRLDKGAPVTISIC